VIFTSFIKIFIPPVTPLPSPSHDYKLQIEAARSVTVLTEYSSRDSLYRETGWGKLSSRRERRKLCFLYSMYHGHAPSYLCDLLPRLVRDVTKYPVRNRNDYNVPRCRLSLWQFSFIPSVINLWNSLDNNTWNTRDVTRDVRSYKRNRRKTKWTTFFKVFLCFVFVYCVVCIKCGCVFTLNFVVNGSRK